jgi:hypothetical protein
MATSRARKTSSRSRKMGSRARKMVSRTARKMGSRGRKMGSRARKMGSRARKMMGGDEEEEALYEENVVARIQQENKEDGLGGPPTGNNQYKTGTSGKKYKSKERDRGVFIWEVPR